MATAKRRACRVGTAILGLALVAGPSALAQQKAAPVPAAVAPAPGLPMPQPETMIILIRITLLALNAANQTGNDTVLRDMAAPSFREANTAARLSQIFQGLHDQGVELSPVAIVPPQIIEAPLIDGAGVLRLAGHFPTQPLQINFQLHYQPVNGRWALFGVSVGATPAPAPQPAADAAPPPAGAKEQAKKK